MSGKARIKLNSDVLRAITTPAIETACYNIAGRAGDGIAWDVQQGKTRPHGIVRSLPGAPTETVLSRNSLLKAIGA